MSDFRIDQITNQAGTAGPQIAGITTFSGSSGLVMPSGATEYRGGRGRGFFAGGTPVINTFFYITIASLGNASDFGDLSSAKNSLGGCSSSTRGIFAGGSPGDTVIDYVTIQATGNAFNFGSLTVDRRGNAACSNQTRGLFAGSIPGNVRSIDYITIASLGDASEFGNLTQNSGWGEGTSSTTRGLFQIAGFPASVNSIEYITIATTGDAQDFGDLTQAKRSSGACSSLIRGVFGGGHPGAPAPANTTIEIDYVTIASLGDAIDFGDLTVSRYPNATSSLTRGVFGGGFAQPANGRTNTIDYVTIATLGNAQDFGDLLFSTNNIGALSDAHGGLGD